MCPFIKDTHTSETPSTFSKKQREFTRYVEPDEYDPEVHELVDPSSQQVLEAWAEELPEEYDPVEGYVGDSLAPLSDREFLDSPWRDAVEEVEATDSLSRLQELLDLELERDPEPRQSVLAALEDKGIAVPAAEEEDEEPDEDEDADEE